MWRVSIGVAFVRDALPEHLAGLLVDARRSSSAAAIDRRTRRRRRTSPGLKVALPRLLTALVTKMRCAPHDRARVAEPGNRRCHRMFSPLAPFHRSGRRCAPLTPAASRAAKRRPAPGRSSPAAGSGRTRSAPVRTMRRSAIGCDRAGGPPRAAIDDHAARLAVVGLDVEVHEPVVHGEAIAALALAVAYVRRRQDDRRRLDLPRALEGRPPFTLEREGAGGIEARGEEPECERCRGQRDGACRALTLAIRATATTLIARPRRVRPTGRMGVNPMIKCPG